MITKLNKFIKENNNKKYLVKARDNKHLKMLIT